MRNLKEGVDMGTVRCSPPPNRARTLLMTYFHSTWVSIRTPPLHPRHGPAADSISEPYIIFALHKKVSTVPEALLVHSRTEVVSLPHLVHISKR